MPLSVAEKTQLQADAAQLTNDINALVPDPNPNPLQVKVDAMKAAAVQVQQATDALVAANNALQTAASLPES
jgi:hypothetical protein